MAINIKAEVNGQQLVDLVRRNTNAIENGLIDINQVRIGEERLNILMADGEKSFVVAELKNYENDEMLWQAIDYYDYFCADLEAYIHLYGEKRINPTKPVRLMLIAPSFSQTLINRCKWLRIPISLFRYDCLKLNGTDDLSIVFSKEVIPSPPKKPDLPDPDGALSRFADSNVANRVLTLIENIKQWKPGRISVESSNHAISMNIDGLAFAFIVPSRKYYVLSIYENDVKWSDFDKDEKWVEYTIHGRKDLDNVLPIAKLAMERREKRSNYKVLARH